MTDSPCNDCGEWEAAHTDQHLARVCLPARARRLYLQNQAMKSVLIDIKHHLQGGRTIKVFKHGDETRTAENLVLDIERALSEQRAENPYKRALDAMPVTITPLDIPAGPKRTGQYPKTSMTTCVGCGIRDASVTKSRDGMMRCNDCDNPTLS